jgi:4-carboxymuconolactone decarboxylase
MKLMTVMIAALTLLGTTWAQGQHTQKGRRSASMQTTNDITMVTPALAKYAQGPLAELWKRPGVTPRDRSIVTISALIARNQTIEMPYYFNLALDNGVKPQEISETTTHLAFYSGWENAMSAVTIAKAVFADRKIGADGVPQAAAGGGSAVGAGAGDRDQFGNHTKVLGTSQPGGGRPLSRTGTAIKEGAGVKRG